MRRLQNNKTISVKEEAIQQHSHVIKKDPKKFSTSKGESDSYEFSHRKCYGRQHRDINEVIVAQLAQRESTFPSKLLFSHQILDSWHTSIVHFVYREINRMIHV